MNLPQVSEGTQVIVSNFFELFDNIVATTGKKTIRKARAIDAAANLLAKRLSKFDLIGKIMKVSDQ